MIVCVFIFIIFLANYKNYLCLRYNNTLCLQCSVMTSHSSHATRNLFISIFIIISEAFICNWDVYNIHRKIHLLSFLNIYGDIDRMKWLVTPNKSSHSHARQIISSHINNSNNKNNICISLIMSNLCQPSLISIFNPTAS